MQLETWRNIPDYDGRYQVSTDGRVRSKRCVKSKWKILKQRIDNNGYLYVVLYGNGHRRQIQTHRLIGQTFLGELPRGWETRHIDGNKFNNRVCNLRYGTPYENAQDRIRHGHTAYGSKSSTAILTEKDVDAIVSLIRDGHKGIDIAIKFGVCRSTISKIKKGKNWKHITGGEIS